MGERLLPTSNLASAVQNRKLLASSLWACPGILVMRGETNLKDILYVYTGQCR